MLSGFSLPFCRNVFLLILTGVLAFWFSGSDLLDDLYDWVFPPDLPSLGSSPNNRSETLGVAEKIYVLSLPSRADRRRDMEILRETLGLSWAYMEAIDTKNTVVNNILESVRAIREMHPPGSAFTWPQDIPGPEEHVDPWSPGFLSLSSGRADRSMPMLCASKNNTVKPYSPNVPEYHLLTPARIACWYSHVTVIQSVANSRNLKDDDTVIVLEDDVDMERDIRYQTEHLWTFLPKDWDIVFLGHCWSNESAYPPLNTNDQAPDLNGAEFTSRIHPSKKPYCTHAYAITRAGARRLLTYLRYPQFAYSRAIDRAFAWLIQSGLIKSFSIVPSIVVQRKVDASDIMPGKGSRWKDTLRNGVFQDKSS